MAYDEALTQRMRKALKSTEGITEKRMMGGVCFFHQEALKSWLALALRFAASLPAK